MKFLTPSLAALTVLAACQGAPPESPTPPAATPSQAAPTEAPAQDVIVGGYGAANEENPELAQAQKLAIEELYRRHPTRALVEKVTSEVQVVAGLNYKFQIEMSGAPEQRARYEVVVFRGLDRTMKVTSVTKLN